MKWANTQRAIPRPNRGWARR